MPFFLINFLQAQILSQIAVKLFDVECPKENLEPLKNQVIIGRIKLNDERVILVKLETRIKLMGIPKLLYLLTHKYFSQFRYRNLFLL